MHRNVFFKDCTKVPEMPFSSLDSQATEDLWDWMDGQWKVSDGCSGIAAQALAA
jgi:hypothetical protein